MSFLKEFKDFAMKGNVLDLAIGVVIGAAFGKIVTSLVKDIITPIISLITGKIEFTKLSISIGAAELNYGSFITSVIDFLIIALTIFIVIKQINRFIPKPAPAAVSTKDCPFCRTSIHIDATKCPNCTSDLKQQ